ncbi:HotDog domain-containing protein [Flagelloscypha sp. PMI_526]|nr:HotDog domain-containing protein [Flagelloscypha sp. PMI_526]
MGFGLRWVTGFSSKPPSLKMSSLVRPGLLQRCSKLAGPARTLSTSNIPPASVLTPRKRNISFLTAASVAGVALTSYALGSVYPPSLLALLFPRPAPAPINAATPEGQAKTAEIESNLQSLPSLQAHRTVPEADQWYETRPYVNIPEERRVNSLTAGALRGPGRLAVPALVRAKYDEQESAVWIHVGRGLCGYDGIVHGGLLATLLDETMGRTAIMNLPDKIGVTATLGVKYRAPTKADQFIVIKTRVQEVKGRRVTVTARVEDVDGKLLVEAESLFVQPRYAKLLDTKGIKQAMGSPDAPPPSTESIPVSLGDGKP